MQRGWHRSLFLSVGCLVYNALQCSIRSHLTEDDISLMSSVSIYHNPRCSKSRQTLQLLEDNGISPNIVLYLETPPTADDIADLLKKLGLSARQVLRKGEDAYKENNLKNTALSDAELVAAMAAHPKLIERPIVVKGSKAVLGRPPENVLALV